ncbi:hypothetical protein MMC12_000474 [Toensbergia leucococca]|nr:hypothetical protein [Toensbergia leucococca]
MDPAPTASRQSPSQPTNSSRYTHPSLDTNAGEGNSRNGGRNVDNLVRGHSDGDILDRSLGLYDRAMNNELVAGETWMDFLRQSPNAGQEAQERAQANVRRAAIIAADRKRRFTGHQDYARRRSASSLSFGQVASHRMRESMPQAVNNHPLANPQNTTTPPARQCNTDRPLPEIPTTPSRIDSHSGDIVLPRWQPDTEVSKCPICGTTFSFWYRKHHCRKCGRVVCANCSPHRITIPRQFIVRSPLEASLGINARVSSNIEVVDLTDDVESPAPLEQRSENNGRSQSRDCHLGPSLGGGQEVRLCNPCVPDPNPLPPPLYPSPSQHVFHSRPRLDAVSGPQPPPVPAYASSDHQCRRIAAGMLSSGSQQIGPNHSQRDSASFDTNSTRTATVFSPTLNSSVTRRHSHAPQLSEQQQPAFPPLYSSIYGSAPGSSAHEHHVDSLVQEHRSSHNRHRHHASTGNVVVPSRYRSMLDAGSPIPARIVPPTQLREEDECPVCHCALPPKEADGSETARETHVASCIESHFSSTSPRISRPPPSTATAAAVAATATTTSQAGFNSAPTAAARPEVSRDISSSSFAQRRRTTGMVVYHASEKDCIGEDGERAQECVICFEDFAVGDEMGRLECLCKFHKVPKFPSMKQEKQQRLIYYEQSCIRLWWDTKGVGACPVHQGGL